jgi:Protein of unknown function (DUF1625).
MSRARLPILVGLGLIVAGSVVYALDSWRSESRNTKIDYVLKNARSITTIDVPALENGELVIASDVPLPGEPLVDPDLGISVEALGYSRSVQILQWRETETTTDDRTEYHYRKEWVNRPISSSLFHESHRYRNRGSLPFRNLNIKPETISLGDLKLDNAYHSNFSSSSRFRLSREMYDELPAHYRSRFYVSEGGGLVSSRFPDIGDVRVKFSTVEPRQVTVVGAFQDGSIVPAQTEAGEVALLVQGNLSLDELAATEKQSNRNVGMFLKIVAGLLAVGGIVLTIMGARISRSSLPNRPAY